MTDTLFQKEEENKIKGSKDEYGGLDGNKPSENISKGHSSAISAIGMLYHTDEKG